MITKKKTFFKGVGLLAAFMVVLVIMFMPIFEQGNTLNYMDHLYNTISKGSAYFIPKLQKENKSFGGRSIDMELVTISKKAAEQTIALFEKSGVSVIQDDNKLNVKGDLGAILENCLLDSDVMFHNNGSEISQKYGYDEKQALYNWWKALKGMDLALKRQGMFEEAKFVSTVQSKAVECAFNYYRIEPQKIMDKFGIVLFSLVFYVVYTLWFGFSIMYLFEGWGMRLEH